MNILVTGGLGFIGHNVVNLLQRDHKVTVYDSLTDYGVLNQTELRWLITERRKKLNDELIIGDITNHNMLEYTVKSSRPATIIHLASFPRAKVVNTDPMVGSTVMVNALIDMLLLSKEHNVKRFVYISSSMVYGDFQCGVREDGECAPQGFYAIMKYSGELLVKDFCLSNGIEYVIVRPSAVYGPMDVEDRVVSKFLLNAIRNEPLVVKGADEILDFSYITDTARGIALASTVSAAANQTYNITRGCGHTLLEAAQLAIKVTKSKSEIIILDKDKTFPSRGSLGISKAMDELGYLPEINIEEGFQLYAEWLNNSIYRTGSPV